MNTVLATKRLRVRGKTQNPMHQKSDSHVALEEWREPWMLLLLPGSTPPSLIVLPAFWGIPSSPLCVFWEELSIKGPFTPLDKGWACDPGSTNHIVL